MLVSFLVPAKGGGSSSGEYISICNIVKSKSSATIRARKATYVDVSDRSGSLAKDALGNDVVTAAWLRTHLPGDRSLVQVDEHR